MASYEIHWKQSAARELRRMDPQQIPRIIKAVAALSNAPFASRQRKLRGSERGHRIRVGDYRVIYQVDVRSRVVTIYHVRHRGQAYRR